MVMVVVRKGESLDQAIRRFKKKVDDDGVIKEFRERRYFVKPSVKKRLKRKEAIRKSQLKAREQIAKDARG
jgi:small subunit ribosomal protein S21